MVLLLSESGEFNLWHSLPLSGLRFDGMSFDSKTLM